MHGFFPATIIGLIARATAASKHLQPLLPQLILVLQPALRGMPGFLTEFGKQLGFQFLAVGPFRPLIQPLLLQLQRLPGGLRGSAVYIFERLLMPLVQAERKRGAGKTGH